MALTLRKPTTPRRAREQVVPGNRREVVVGIGFGAFVGLLALTGAMIPLVALMVGLIGFAVLLRSAELPGIAFGAFLLATFTVPWNRLDIVLLEVSDYLTLVALGCYILMRLQRPGEIDYTPYKPVFAALGVMALGGAIGMFFEPPGPYFYWLPDYNIAGFGGNVANLFRFLSGTMGPLALFALANLNRKQLVLIVYAYASGQVLSAFLGLAGLVPGGNGRNWGLAEHPGHFGTQCLLAMACVIALYVRRNQLHPWMAGAAAILLAGSYTSGSRAALGGMAIFLVVVGPLTKKRLIMGGAVAGMAVVILALSLGLGNKVGGENALARSLNNTETAQGSNAFREKTQKDTWHRWSENPLTGNGFNYIRPSHNVYLGIGTSTGVIGIVGFLWYLRILGRKVWSNRHDQMVLVMGAGYGAYLFVAVFDNLFWWRWLWFYLSALIAVAATAVAAGQDPEVVDTRVAGG